MTVRTARLRPAALVPGTLMVFAGVAQPADRAAIVRYVFEQSSAP